MLLPISGVTNIFFIIASTQKYRELDGVKRMAIRRSVKKTGSYFQLPIDPNINIF